MDSTWEKQSNGRSRHSGRNDMSETYRSSVSKSSGGGRRRRRVQNSPNNSISESLKLPGSRGDGNNPRLYLTEGKMGDKYDSRGGRQLLPSSAREDAPSTNRTEDTENTEASAVSSNRPKNIASLRITNLKFISKPSLTRQIKMNGGNGTISLKL